MKLLQQLLPAFLVIILHFNRGDVLACTLLTYCGIDWRMLTWNLLQGWVQHPNRAIAPHLLQRHRVLAILAVNASGVQVYFMNQSRQSGSDHSS